MIVDDDPSILITVRTLLEKEGYEVYAVNSGKDCIEEVKRGFKGVILMDIMMPHMDGLDTIREIVKGGYTKGNVIAVITAKNVPDIKTDGLEEYVVDYIVKPFETDELVSSVKKYFTRLQ